MANNNNNQNQTNYMERIKKLLASYQRENEKIVDSLKDYTSKEQVQKNEIIEKLNELSENTQSQTQSKILKEESQKLDELNKNVLSNNDLQNVMTDVSDKLISVNQQGFSTLKEGFSSILQSNESLRSGFSRFNGIMSGFLAPFSDLIEVMGSVKETLVGTFEIMKGSLQWVRDRFSGLINIFRSGSPQERQQLNESERQTELLYGMHEYFLRKEKREMRSDKGKSETWSEWIMQGLAQILYPIFAGLAATIGGIVYSFQIEFKVFYSTFVKPITWFIDKLRQSKFATVLGKFITKIDDFVGGAINKTLSAFRFLGNKVGMLFGKISGFIRYFDELATVISQGFLQVGRIGKMFAGTIGIIRKASKFVPIIGWAITALFGIIDFFRGFFGKSGDFESRIKSGLKEVVEGLINLPVQLLGWIGDYVLGLFGVNIKGGVGKQIMSGIKSIVGNVVSLILSPVETTKQAISSLQSFFSQTWSNITSIFGDVKRIAGNFFGNLGNILLNNTPIGTLYQGLNDLWNMISGGDKKKEKNKGSSSIFTKIQDKLSQVINGITGFFSDIIPSWEDIKSKISGLIPKGVPDWLIPDFLEGGKDKKKKVDTTGKKERNSLLDTGMMGTMKLGGKVPKTGLYQLHKDEYVVPPKTAKSFYQIDRRNMQNVNLDKSSQMTKQVINNKREEIVQNRRDKEETGAYSLLQNILYKLNEINNNLNNTQTENQGVQTPQFQSSDIPDEIENISLLLFNKNWGIT